MRDARGGLAPTDREPHVVAIFPRGEAIRNFIYSGALDEVRRSARVTLLSVLPSDEVRHSLESHADDVLELVDVPERWPVRFAREILDLAHGRWLWSAAAKERWRLRDAEAISVAEKVKRIAKKSIAVPLSTRTGVESLSRFERASSKVFKNTERYVDLFRELKPTLVFNASHVHSRVAIQAVQSAQWLGIPTATFIFSWDNLTSQGRVLPQYDHYLVWSEAIRRQLLEIYGKVSSSQITVTGTPQFDFHFREEYHWSRERFCSEVGADPSRPIVLYCTGMANHMPGEPRIVEGIADMLERSGDEMRHAQLMVRVYPKDLTGRFDELRERRTDIIFQKVPWEPRWLTPMAEDAFLLTNSVRHSAVGINVASTMSLELCMFDKPVINVGYNPPGIDITPIDYRLYYGFDHYRPVVESGAVMLAESEEQMDDMLSRALNQPGEASGKREALIRSMFGDTLDGRSSHRCALRLIELAGGSASPTAAADTAHASMSSDSAKW